MKTAEEIVADGTEHETQLGAKGPEAPAADNQAKMTEPAALAEEMVTARLLPISERRTDMQRKRPAGTKSFGRVDGKATDPSEDFVASRDNPSPQQVGMKAKGRHVVDTEWRRVPEGMVAALRERKQIVQVQEEMSAEELLEAGVIA